MITIAQGSIQQHYIIQRVYAWFFLFFKVVLEVKKSINFSAFAIFNTNRGTYTHTHTLSYRRTYKTFFPTFYVEYAFRTDGNYYLFPHRNFAVKETCWLVAWLVVVLEQRLWMDVHKNIYLQMYICMYLVYVHGLLHATNRLCWMVLKS